MGKTIRIRNLEIGGGRPKVCAIVLGETEREILDLAERANAENCDMIEFRADHYKKILDLDAAKTILGKVRKICRKPIIFTFRRKEEGGKTAVSLEYYKKLLLVTAQNWYADLIDVEASAIGDDKDFVYKLKDYGAFIIISKHDFDKTPTQEEIIQNFFDMKDLGADIVKAAYMPNNKKDVLNLITATENLTSAMDFCPVVAISMGHLGMITRILGEFIESAITFASITKSSAPGQINIDSLEAVLDIIHNNYKKIFLVGFMGTGKTAVANGLANNYGLKKLDLDAYIEKKEHMSIADIFATQTEKGFRDKETKHLRQVLKQNYQVISLGGGIILRNENIDLIKEKGVIVLLTATPETISTRMQHDKTRSWLGENIDMDYIRDLMRSREEAYLQVADIVISTDDKNVDQICKEIVETLGFTL
ncbi:MAG: type I 3-dehydroquinate dehydratase [Parasporobacterium sp.]|nr:type I 3-dehydroquinate dehydratase [Parasporobacterium sp.]